MFIFFNQNQSYNKDYFFLKNKSSLTSLGAKLVRLEFIWLPASLKSLSAGTDCKSYLLTFEFNVQIHEYNLRSQITSNNQ